MVSFGALNSLQPVNPKQQIELDRIKDLKII